MKFNPTSDNFYERLGVEQNVSQENIKAAFFLAVRSYPPEKDPKNYKMIREAYDVLNNPVSRDEYDSNTQYGEELQELLRDIEVAQECEDNNEAIKLAKKVINIAPTVGTHRNRLGLLFMDNLEFKSAKEQFKRAHKIDPKNSAYLINIGDAAKEGRDYPEAEENYQKAWSLDIEDYVAPRRLANLYYFTMQKKQQAYEVLDKAVSADGKVDFQDFFCLYDKVHFLLFDERDRDVAAHLDLLKSISKRKEEKDFAAYILSESCMQLAKRGQFKMASKFIEAAAEMSYDEWRGNNKKHLREYVVFEEDAEIVKEVKGLVSLLYCWYWSAIEKKEFDKYLKVARDNIVIGLYANQRSSVIKNNLAKLKSVYSNVYKIHKDFYDSIITIETPSCANSSTPVSSEPTPVDKKWGCAVVGFVVLFFGLCGIIGVMVSDDASVSQSSTRRTTTNTTSYTGSSSNYLYLKNLKKTIKEQETQIRNLDSYLKSLKAKIDATVAMYEYASRVPQYVLNEYESDVDEFKRAATKRDRIYNEYRENIDRYNSLINR